MTYVLPPDVTATDIEDGLVLLDQRTGRYWQLNRSAATTLRLLLDARSPAEVAAELTRGCPQQATRALADVETLMTQLRAARLVQAGSA
jgi:Coenzyme PQQ synthesis protein D (PqqD)